MYMLRTRRFYCARFRTLRISETGYISQEIVFILAKNPMAFSALGNKIAVGNPSRTLKSALMN